MIINIVKCCFFIIIVSSEDVDLIVLYGIWR